MLKNVFENPNLVNDLSDIDLQKNQMLIAFKDQDGRIHFRQGSLSYPEQITTLDDIKQLAQIPEDLSKQAEVFVHESVEKSLTDFYSAPD